MESYEEAQHIIKIAYNDMGIAPKATNPIHHCDNVHGDL